MRHGLAPNIDITAQALEILDIVKDVEGLACFAVDSYLLNNAGAYITQELGYALAWGAEWMSLLTEAGV